MKSISDTSLFQQSGPANSSLEPYIENYVFFYHPQVEDRLYKNILPCPGISVIFNFRKMYIDDRQAPDVFVIGLHEAIYQMGSTTDEVETIVVRFSPYGCNRLTPFPVADLTNKILPAEMVFGEEILTLHKALGAVHDFAQRVQLLDEFFATHIKAPDTGYTIVAQIADQLRKEPEPVSFDAIRNAMTIPLSTRQIARRFKDTIGVNLQVFIRICRFEMAKSMFFEQQKLSLTDIGYLSGYYDQAHFSKEFKRLSGLNAKDFFPHCALQKMLYTDKNAIDQ